MQRTRYQSCASVMTRQKSQPLPEEALQRTLVAPIGGSMEVLQCS